MTKAAKRSLFLSVAMLTVYAIAAIPAQAAVTPVNTRLSFTSTDTRLVASAGLGGETTTCPTAELTATTNSNGTALFGRITFSGNTSTRVTCEAVRARQSVQVSCPGVIGIDDSVTTSVARTSTSADLYIFGTPACTITNLATGVVTIVDAQVVRNCITIRENTTVAVSCTLTVTVPAFRVSGTALFTGTFTTATNISIS